MFFGTVTLQLEEYTKHCDGEISTLDLLRQVDCIIENCWWSPSKEERILRIDISLLMTAILKREKISWERRRPIVQLLIDRFGEEHLVFEYVNVEE